MTICICPRWVTRPTYQPLKRWLERELSIYLTQVGHGATLDEFRHHVCKLLPDQPPEVTWLFGLDGYLDCGDLDTIIDGLGTEAMMGARSTDGHLRRWLHEARLEA